MAYDKKKKKELEEIDQENKSTIKAYPHRTKWFNNKLQIDVIGAKQKVEELFPEQTGPIRGKRKGKPSDWNRRYKAIYSIEKFARQEFYYSVDNNVGRFHSNLTNIKRELRNYITYNEQKLINVDKKKLPTLIQHSIIIKKRFMKTKANIQFSHSLILSN